MSDKITVEEMVAEINWLIARADNQTCYTFPIGKHHIPMLQAIRKHLERPRVSRKQIAELLNIGHQFAMETMGDGGKRSYSEDLTLALDEMQDKLIELDIEVSDNSEVGRRTSDKEWEGGR